MAKTEVSRKLKNALRGPVVAMTTPFNEDLSLDVEGLRALTAFYVEQGIPNVIAAGSPAANSPVQAGFAAAVSPTTTSTDRSISNGGRHCLSVHVCPPSVS